MRTKVLMWMAASAMVLTLSQPASAHPGRTVVVPFEFYAIGGVCLNPGKPFPPEAAALRSCAAATPLSNEDHVGITVVDSAGQPVYFTVRQGDNNPNFAWGCGTLSGGDLSADGLYPIAGSGPGGAQGEDVVVIPEAGPRINDVLDPGGAPCQGSLDTNMIRPGEAGTVTFVFHDHVA